MRKRVLVGVLLVSLAFLGVARAKPLDDALATIPADALGFVTVPSLKQLDERVQGLIKHLGLEELVPPPQNSPLAMLKEFLNVSAGLDEAGPLSLVVMPASAPEELPEKIALIVPVTDAPALLKALEATEGAGGVWTLTVMGNPVHAVVAGKRVAVSPSEETAKAVAESKTGIADKLKGADRAALEGLDLAVWVGAEPLVKLYQPQIDAMMAFLAVMPEAKAAQQQVEMLVTQTRALTFGAALSQGGALLRFTLTARPDSDMAKWMSLKNTAGSLLDGLPDGKFVMAYGALSDPDSARQGLKTLDALFTAAADSEEINADQLAAIKDALHDALPLVTALRASFEALPEGPGGLIGVTVSVQTTDSAKFIGAIEKALTAVAKLPAKEQMPPEALTYKADAEELANVKVHHLTLDPAKLGADEDDLEKMTAILGADGVKVRVAAVDGKTVVLALGGGSQRMTSVIELNRKGGDPLAQHSGLKSIAEFLPREKIGVFYVAVDELFRLIANVAEATGEYADVPKLPAIKAPVALVTSSDGDGTVRADMFVPMDLLKALVDAFKAAEAGEGAETGEDEEAGY